MASTKQQVSLKALHSLTWTEELIAQVKDYVQTGTIPDDIEEAPHKKSKWRKRFADFTIKGKDLLFVFDGIPPWAKDKDGKTLFDVKLPVTLKVVETDAEREELLTDYYSNVLVNGYRSADSFYDRLSKEYLNVSRVEVRDFLKKMESRQLALPVVEMKIQKPIVIEQKMKQWEMDLVDMSNFSHFNENTTFLLHVIDCHSKFFWSRPLKNKTAELVAFELQAIFLQEGAPEVISSDNGSEFVNSAIEELFLRFNVKQQNSLPYKPTSQGQIERANGTIKRAIYAHMSDHDSKRYIDVLQFLVFAYNNAKHSTTKFSPFQAHRGVDQQISMLAHQNIKKKADAMIESDLKNRGGMEDPIIKGDKVRLSGLALKSVRKLSSISKAKQLVNWSKDLYEVIQVRKDDKGIEEFQLKDSPEEGRWYFRYQLLLVDEEALIKKKSFLDKEDLNFEQRFDNEAHIKLLGMSKGQLKEANKDQGVLEKEEEATEKKRVVRLRKQVDRGFMITH
jgi:hypothetical protein